MEIALMQYFNITKNLVVPNVTNMSGLVGFETDLLVLSKSGYATGVEIKVSKSDLKNDLKKRHIKSLNDNIRPWNKSAKEFYFEPYKYFYYAVPEYLLEDAKKQIPEFSGLLIARRSITSYGQPYISITPKKQSDELFRTKWTKDEQYKLARLGAMRILKYKYKLLK